MNAFRSISGLVCAVALTSSCSSPPEDTPSGAAGSSGGGSGVAGGAGAGVAGTGGTAGSVATGGSAPTAGTAGSATGNGGSPTGGTSGGATTGPFELLWEDNFDTFDGGRWEKRDHTFPENAGRFNPSNVVVEGGLLKLKVTDAPSGEGDGYKQYAAAEVRSTDSFKYGRFEARIKFHLGDGIVSSLFTYLYDPAWNEIDIEFLGNQGGRVQYNIITSPVGDPNNREYQPYVYNLGYPPWGDFHDYAFEWVPNEVRFFVDGVQTHVDSKNVAERLTNDVHLHMNCWPTDNDATTFAGVLDTAAIPTEAQYDWVRVYRYVP